MASRAGPARPRRCHQPPAALVVELPHRVREPALAGQRRRARHRQLGHEPPRAPHRVLGTASGGPRPRTLARALPRSREELPEPALGLEVPPHHHGVVRLERLCHPVHQRPREPQRVPHLAHRGPRPVRDEVADHPRVLRAVVLVDVLDDLLPPLGGEVDVHVRVRRPSLVDEPLEQQLVADRVHAGDPQHVRHDRARGAAPALRRDPARLREPHQVPADEEELRETRLLDDVQLVGELPDDGRRQRVVPAPGALPAQLGEVREGRLALRHGKPGKR